MQRGRRSGPSCQKEAALVLNEWPLLFKTAFAVRPHNREIQTGRNYFAQPCRLVDFDDFHVKFCWAEQNLLNFTRQIR